MRSSVYLIILFFSVSLTAPAQDFSAFKREIYRNQAGDELPYRILYPRKYQANRNYPLIIFLHGSGERGNDNEAQLLHAGSFFLNEYEKGNPEAIVVLPQCPESDSWIDREMLQGLKNSKTLYADSPFPATLSSELLSGLLDQLITRAEVDKSRIALIGMSMGSFGLFDLLSRRPDTFSRAVSICGGGSLKLAERYAPHTAIRIYHGSDDTVVSPALSRSMAYRLKVLGGDVEYTEYKGVEHDSWVNAFAEPGLMEWLCSPVSRTVPAALQPVSDKNGALLSPEKKDENKGTDRGVSSHYLQEVDVSYIGAGEKDPYRQERCKLDIYYPAGKTGFSTLIWFHGGGLEGGNKEIPQELKEKGIAIVAPNYRLSPRAASPAYIADVAEAVAWVFRQIASYGGDPDRIYISGHSAGGYLSLMLALDKSWLKKQGVDADRVGGVISVSGQTNTHYTIRKERGLPDGIPVIDELAPINHARKDASPILLITGDRNLEMVARYEENAHLNAVLKGVGNKEVRLYELQGFDHGTVCAPAYSLILEWMEKLEDPPAR